MRKVRRGVGQRAIKYSASGALREETLYFNKMFQITKVGSVPSTESKHIYVGEVRIATKQKHEGNVNLEQEGKQQYYYHGDHLGSAQLVTDWKGDLYEHLEYAPYGELWIDRAAMDVGQNATPFRFTGKERDKETGLYYYGARYLDPKTSRWISGDPALGEYVPQAPVDDEARKYNRNLPGMGGIFNTVNMHVYHYAGNNPVNLTDPDGRDSGMAIDDNGAFGQGHVGLFVQGNGKDYYFYEFTGLSDDPKINKNNGIPENAAVGYVYSDRYSTQVHILSNDEIKLPSSEFAPKIGQASRAGAIERHFEDKVSLLKFLENAGYTRTLDLGTNSSQDKLIRNAAIELGKSVGSYDFLLNNCSHYAFSALTTPMSGVRGNIMWATVPKRAFTELVLENNFNFGKIFTPVNNLHR